MTTITVLSLSRRHVLGTLYERCEPIKGTVPVYLAGDKRTLLGHADESLGHYADAFSFHLDPDTCKKLSAGYFTYAIDYEHADRREKGPRCRLKLRAITLTGRTNYEKPIPRYRLTEEEGTS